MSTSVVYPAQPEQILKALGKLWTSLGQEEKQQGKPTVLRACAMTLIVATDETDGGFECSQTISELMHEHPSRGIVIAVSAGGDHDIEARVLAQCWKPFGKAQQICCEQIEISARPESWPNIGPTLTGIIAADLPVVFWCRYKGALRASPTPQQKEGLDAVMNLSTKVIIDTEEDDPHDAFALIRDWQNQGRIVGDLEWTRLTRWRQPIAQVFDNTARTNKFSNFNQIEIKYSEDKPSASVYYAGAWLSAPYGAQVKFTQIDAGVRGLHCVHLTSPTEEIKFERTGPGCMTLSSTNGRARQYSFATPNIDSLMNEELAIVGHDPQFEAAFAKVQELLA